MKKFTSELVYRMKERGLRNAICFFNRRISRKAYGLIEKTKVFEENRNKRVARRFKKTHQIVVVLVCSDPSSWHSQEELYQVLKKDRRFKVIILASPMMEGDVMDNYRADAFLKQKYGDEYLQGYDVQKNDYIDLKDLNADYFVFDSHYNYRNPYELSYFVARRNSKVIYIPYSITVLKGDIQDCGYSFEELRFFDLIFAETEINRKIIENYRDNAKAYRTLVKTVGTSKFDIIREKCKPIKTKFKQVVMYCPRWSLSEGTSSFFQIYPMLFELARDNPDIQYILLRHPLIEQGTGKVWGMEKWNAFLKEFDSYDNAILNPSIDYLDAFSKATVFISDSSSMLFEFFITGKPVIYMQMKNLEYNEFGSAVNKGFYNCKDSIEANQILAQLREGIDPLAEKRKEILETAYSFCDGNSAKRMADEIYDDYLKTKDS